MSNHHQHPLREPPDCGLPSGDLLLLALANEASSWITELKDYLQKGILPHDDADAKRVAWQANTYIIHDDELYRRCPNRVALQCVSTT